MFWPEITDFAFRTRTGPLKHGPKRTMLERGALIKGHPKMEKERQLEATCDVVLAGIEYAGIGGSTQDCQDAVLRLIQFGTRIVRVAILSA
jgi:hypothetical protein